MRSSIEALQRDISEIRAMAAAIKPANELLIESSSPEVRAYLSVRRRFDYSALIIALYASFERYVEDIVNSYARIITTKERYGALPQRLIAKHLAKTAEIISKGTIDPNRYPGVTARNLVENLHSCLSDAWPYQLNDVAITSHDRNIRYDELGSLLGLVDIIHDLVCRAQPLINWHYKDQKLEGPQPNSVPTTVVRQRLDDFVDRRNDVAHRGGNPSDRLGIEDMLGLVDFINALATSISNLFYAHYLEKMYGQGSASELLKLAEGPFAKGKIWVVEPVSIPLHIGQPIFALSDSFLARWGRIETLQVDGTEYREVQPGGSKSVGIQFDFRAPSTARLYILAAEDETIWIAKAE